MSDITLTNQTGTEVFRGRSTGSQPWRVVRVPITSATANILTGITIDTPDDGDWMPTGLGAIAIPTAWNGTDPRLAVMTQGADPLMGEAILDADLTQQDAPYAPGATGVSIISSSLRLTGTGPLVVMLYKGSTGGDPGSTTGTAEVMLAIVKVT